MDAPKRILVVDDDDMIRAFLESALSERGYEVVEAPDGAVALRLLAAHEPDLILLDMRMPVMDGWQFAAAYGQRPAPRAPIIVLTAATDAAAFAGQINADAFLSKPFQLGQLYACVAKHTGFGT
jgi:CheY-like chemotaxis protein